MKEESPSFGAESVKILETGLRRLRPAAGAEAR